MDLKLLYNTPAYKGGVKIEKLKDLPSDSGGSRTLVKATWKNGAYIRATLHHSKIAGAYFSLPAPLPEWFGLRYKCADFLMEQAGKQIPHVLRDLEKRAGP